MGLVFTMFKEQLQVLYLIMCALYNLWHYLSAKWFIQSQKSYRKLIKNQCYNGSNVKLEVIQNLVYIEESHLIYIEVSTKED